MSSKWVADNIYLYKVYKNPTRYCFNTRLKAFKKLFLRESIIIIIRCGIHKNISFGFNGLDII